MEILALLTARGNNTLKDKNILKVNRLPVLSYPCKEAKKVKEIKNYFVSSEDKKILDIASKYGFKKILRPKKFARANSQHIDTLTHSITYLKKLKIKPDVILVLLGNAPIIKHDWIKKSINILKKDKAISSVVPVLKDNDHNPYRSKKIKNGYLNNFFNFKKKNVPSNRQQLPDSYFLAHNFWLIRTKSILKNDGEKPWSFLGKKVKPLLIQNSIDIHHRIDLEIAKKILKIL
jgi:CMP-N,N'-diacetyllegionaminic acid synthase